MIRMEDYRDEDEKKGDDADFEPDYDKNTDVDSDEAATKERGSNPLKEEEESGSEEVA